MTNKQTNGFRQNLANLVRDHLTGKHHRRSHRFTFGILIMTFGVYIHESIADFHILPLTIVGATIGYGIHGIGLFPFISSLLEEEVI